MIDMFGAPTGASQDPEDTSAPGTQAYQQNIVGNAARSMKPAYQQAMTGMDQSLASRGLLGSGIGASEEGGLSQGYANKVGDVAGQAATHSADINEENRRMEQQRNWQVQDRNLQMNWLQQQADRAQGNLENQRWADMVGGAGKAVGGAVGSYLGGPAGGAAGSAVAGGMLGQTQQPTYDPASQGQQQGPLGMLTQQGTGIYGVQDAYGQQQAQQNPNFYTAAGGY